MLFTCYSPVRHSQYCYCSFDLHGSGTPPAFVLSQDQTLMFKPNSNSTSRGLNSIELRCSLYCSFQCYAVFKVRSLLLEVLPSDGQLAYLIKTDAQCQAQNGLFSCKSPDFQFLVIPEMPARLLAILYCILWDSSRGIFSQIWMKSFESHCLPDCLVYYKAIHI
jgi:hypothetical protein